MKASLQSSLAAVPEQLNSPALVSFLDLARWLAAALVFVAHLRNPLFLGYGDLNPVDRTLPVKAWYFITGWHAEAVVVFFVLSGFLVGGAGLAKLQAGRFDPASYAIDRVSRLYVAFLPALMLGFALDMLGVQWFGSVGFWDGTHPMIAEKVGSAAFGSALSLHVLLGNVFMLQNYFVAPLGSNQPLWSISGEFWFYVIFLLAVLLSRSRSAPASRVLCGIGAAMIFALLGVTFLDLLGLWLVGVCAALISRSRWTPTWAAGLLFAAVLVASRLANSYFDAHALGREAKNYAVAITFALLLISMRGRQVRWMERIAKPNAFLASFSYSLYLLHFPLMLFILALLHATGWFPGIAHGFRPTDPHGLLAYALTIVSVYGVCWGFAQVTEARTGSVRRLAKNWLQSVGPRPAPKY